MNNTKILTLINKLHEKTEAGKLDWEASASSNKFLTTLSEYSVGISEEGDDFVLTIADSWGNLVERMSDPELKEEDSGIFELMQSLYYLARRNARGADKAIDEILDII